MLQIADPLQNCPVQCDIRETGHKESCSADAVLFKAQAFQHHTATPQPCQRWKAIYVHQRAVCISLLFRGSVRTEQASAKGGGHRANSAPALALRAHQNWSPWALLCVRAAEPRVSG